MNRKIDSTVGARQYHRKNKMASIARNLATADLDVNLVFHGDRDRFVEFAAAELEDR
jgi:hypothetical protein